MMVRNKKQIISFLVLVLLILSIVPVVNSFESTEMDEPSYQGIEVICTSVCFDNGTEVADQKQDETCGWSKAGTSPSIYFAQGFKPTVTKLTRVWLRMWKVEDAPDDWEITCSIRRNLGGSDLTSAQVTSDRLTHTRTLWIYFDFPDIDVVPEETYYIVRSVSEATPSLKIYWTFEYPNPYSRGAAYVSYDFGNNWEFLSCPQGPFPDFTFRTYGIDYPPDIPRINGTVDGKRGREYQYTIKSIDPEGHDVSYLVDWGDNSSTDWVGPYPSGEEIVVNHTWSSRGIYVVKVKAKDTFNVEGDWGTLEVSMPKNKVLDSYPLLQWFLEFIKDRFPRLILS